MALPKIAAAAVKAAMATKAAATVKTVMTAAAVGSTLLKAGDQLAEGNAARRAGEEQYAASMAEAAGQRLGKESAFARGALEIARIGDQGREVASENMAGAAASGFDPTDQTATLIQSNIVAKTRMQQLIEQARADDEASGIEYGARLTELRGAYALQEGKRAQKASRWKAGGTLLKGAAMAGYARWGTPGMSRVPVGGVAAGGSGFNPSDLYAKAQRAMKAGKG